MAKLKLKLPENLGDVLTKEEMKKVVGGYGSYDGSGNTDEWYGSGSNDERKCVCNWNRKEEKCILSGACPTGSYCKDLGPGFSVSGNHICATVIPK